ncbi:hypothetical protein [Chroococcidiopsis sp.]|uniref:hypothetical protein n=1 Tax=Chroococcidiopsis sp. TaxID=3088168 RepID=UPI003F2CC9D2
MRYARIDAITRKLAGRITVVDITDSGITGVTETRIGTDLIRILAEEQEEFIDIYLSMIYELPLKQEHSFLSGIVEKLIISEVYLTYFPTVSESTDSTDTFGSIMRMQALNSFQSLFNGLGIFIPDSTASSNQIQNDETRQQMANKAIILPGEKLKSFIGYDYDGDSVSDTDLFKLNGNVQPSFYTAGKMEKKDDDIDVINHVRIRPRRKTMSDDINFW